MLDDAATLAGWSVLVLRPAATRAPLVRALLREGARPLPLPALRLAPAPDPVLAGSALAAALQAPLVIFTSPAAVRFATRLAAWRAPPPGAAIAIGAGTATALARAGAAGARHPRAGSDSEAVLAMPELRAIDGQPLGLVTAPGGRGVLAAALSARGALLRRADVYRRLPGRFDARHRRLLEAALRELPAVRLALLATSAEALQAFLAGLAPHAQQALQRALVVVPGARLAGLARAGGAREVAQAGGASPAALVAALALHARCSAFR